MSGGVVCYIERTPGGGGIKRLRLIAAGLARQWTAPEPRSVSSVDAGLGAGPGGPSASVNAARAGATWIAETLDSVGLKRLAAVCVDAEGSICAWLSSHSPEPSVVRATIAQSGVDADGSGAGLGAARLIAGSDSGAGGSGGGMGGGGGGAGFLAETSVQALATIEPDQPKPSGLRFRRSGAPAAPQRKQRYAVLAVQDAIVRVLLDELDSRSIEVDRVVSIWHAMAGGWDRSAPASLSDRLVSSDSPGGAVILVEPAGRLVWAWTRAGELVAGGSMRLASHARRAEQSGSDSPTPTPTQSQTLAPSTPPAPDSARRTSSFDSTDAEPADSGVTLEFSTAEAGRLAVDWLSWSAQLGHCPQRVVCLSAPNVSDGALGPEALFSHLATCWPGATIDGAVHDDPVGATIGRLAGLGPEMRKPLPDEQSPAALLPYHVRPREALTDLSARPGRADRRLHQWIGVSLLAAAVLVSVIGWKINRSIAAAKAELVAAKDAGKQAVAAAAVLAPDVLQPNRKPADALQAAVDRLRDQAKYLKPPRPMIEETVRVLAALNDANAGAPADASADAPDASPSDPDAPPDAPRPSPGAPTPGAGKTLLTELELSSVSGKVQLTVPDADTGPNILDRILKSPGVLNWTGSTQSSGFGGAPAGAPGGSRNYVLLAPSWPEAPTTTAATPGAPKPAVGTRK